MSSMQQILHYDSAILPFLRAWLLGYTTAVGPQVLAIFASLALGKGASWSSVLNKLIKSIRKGFRIRGGLAFSAGVSIGGGKLLERVLVEPLIRKAYEEMMKRRKGKGKADDEELKIKATSTFISTTLSSLIAISLLSASSAPRSSRTIIIKNKLELEPAFLTSPYPTFSLADPVNSLKASPSSPTRRRSSKTLDLTLFFLVRALDILTRGVYQWSNKGEASNNLVSWIATQGDALLFAASCCRIMWCWFYLPERLPASYNRWIAKLSRMDSRLLAVLRYARAGEFVYGKEPSEEVSVVVAQVAAAMSTNPFYIDRLDCTIIHGLTGATSSCEVNAIKRFTLAFLDSLAIYLPVHLIPVLLFSSRSFIKTPLATLSRIILGSFRSSAFLATFVASIYASVCLVRTRLPQSLALVGIKFDPNIWDGLGTQLGVIVCGFSVLIENKRRRREMALYTAPRALYTLIDGIALPRGRKGELIATWVERSLFALSTALVTTATIYQPELVSGVVRGVFKKAIGDDWK